MVTGEDVHATYVNIRRGYEQQRALGAVRHGISKNSVSRYCDVSKFDLPILRYIEVRYPDIDIYRSSISRYCDVSNFDIPIVRYIENFRVLRAIPNTIVNTCTCERQSTCQQARSGNNFSVKVAVRYIQVCYRDISELRYVEV